MKLRLIILSFLVSTLTHSQINTFELDCKIKIDVQYNTNNDNTIELAFFWEIPNSIKLNIEETKSILNNQGEIKIKYLTSLINNKNGYLTPLEDLLGYKFKDMDTKTEIDYLLKKSFSASKIIDIENDKIISYIYNSLKTELAKDNVVFCSENVFSSMILQKVTSLKNKIISTRTKVNTYNNKEITSLHPANRTTTFWGKEKKITWYETDIRNPIAFTEFIVRTPRTNGKDVLSKVSNLSSYHYMKPGSIINILFKEEVYKQLNNSTRLAISAYLKRKDGTVVPITVSGFYEVKTETNELEFEKNISSKNKTNKENSQELTYNFQITSKANLPIQAEVNTSMANPQPEDKLIITVSNVSDGNVSFSTTFEYENYGWQTQPSGGFSWINTPNQGDSTFRPAGSSGVSFHYKLNKGARFWRKLINPSFGPELIVLQDNNQNTNIGLGMSVSTLLRTLKFGYGWYLVGENGRPYVSIGVNFIEGYKSISSILSRSKE